MQGRDSLFVTTISTERIHIQSRHGKTGRTRGGRAVEVYNNNFSGSNYNKFIGGIRSGGVLFHDNTISGYWSGLTEFTLDTIGVLICFRLGAARTGPINGTRIVLLFILAAQPPRTVPARRSRYPAQIGQRPVETLCAAKDHR